MNQMMCFDLVATYEESESELKAGPVFKLGKQKVDTDMMRPALNLRRKQNIFKH